MAVQLRAANNGTGSAATATIPMPAGLTAADLCLFGIRVGATGQFMTQAGGAGGWQFQFQASDSAGGYTYLFAYRLIAPGDSAPVLTWPGSNAYTTTSIAVYSDAGGGLSVDTWAAELDTGSSGNTVTPNAAAAAGQGEASVILTVARAATETVPASFTYTPPSGWTTPANGTQWTASANSRFSAAAYQLGVSGTVTPGAQTLTDSTSGAYFFSVAHALITETLPAVRLAASPPQMRTELIPGGGGGRIIRI